MKGINSLLRAIIGSLIIALPALVGSTAHAQLMVDAGGPRDMFFSSGEDATGLAGFHAKLNTDDKGVALTYFGKPANYLGLWAMDLKVSAVDGVGEFFRFERWPKMDLSIIGNKTFSYDGGWAWSVTPRLTATHIGQSVFDPSLPAGSQLSEHDFFGGQANLLFSCLLPEGWGAVGLSFGYKHTSNYEDLAKTTVGTVQNLFPGPGGAAFAALSQGQTVRYGSLNHYNEFPLSAIYTRQFEPNWIDALCKKVMFWDKDIKNSKTSFVLLTSPYASLLPRDEGKPTHSIGLNLVLRKGVTSKDETNPNEDKFSFPVSLFIERKNAFSGKPDLTIGSALIYKFK